MNGRLDSQPAPARLSAAAKGAYDFNMFGRDFLIGLALLATGATAHAPAAQSLPEQGYTTLSNGRLLDFRYSFPTIVGSDPTLLAAIHADRAKNYTEALAGARDDAAARKPQGFPFHPHEFWRDWTVSGQSDRLMSLRSQTETFTGGAHGMHVTGLKLWDKQQETAIDFAQLFASPATFWSLLKQPFCAALSAERLRRVHQAAAPCPDGKDLVLIPADADSNWAFDTIRVVADPYVAGSYAEGRYEVPLPVTSALIAALKPQYRSSFEAQRPQ
jgi:hypothetical protein